MSEVQHIYIALTVIAEVEDKVTFVDEYTLSLENCKTVRY